jgi:hypothetical protein
MHPDVDAKFNTAVAGEDEAVTARVRSWLRQIETGKIERAGLSKAFDAFMSHPAVEFAQAEFVPLGPVTGLVFRGTSRRGSTVDYRYNASFGTAQEYIVLSIDARNKIAAFLFKPYDDSPDFTKVKTNPKLTAAAGRVVDWLRQLASGRIDRSRLTRSFSASFTPSLAARAKRAFAPLGDLKQLILRRQPAHAGSMVYGCEVSFASAKAKVSLAIDATDRIDAFTYTLSR